MDRPTVTSAPPAGDCCSGGGNIALGVDAASGDTTIRAVLLPRAHADFEQAYEIVSWWWLVWIAELDCRLAVEPHAIYALARTPAHDAVQLVALLRSIVQLQRMLQLDGADTPDVA